MTKQEVRAAIKESPTKDFYVRIPAALGPIVGFFEPISVTRLLKNAKLMQKAEHGPYLEFRPDLKGKIINGDKIITLFTIQDATR